MLTSRTLTLFAALLLASLTSCVEYNAPPEPQLVFPMAGLFTVGEPLTIEFSEPIRPDTLSISVYDAGEGARDIENERVAGLEAKLSGCTPATSPCGNASITMAEDGLSAELLLMGEEFSKIKVPFELEIASGLMDTDGNATAAPWSFDFLFGIAEAGNGEPVEFEDGHYILVGQIQQPLPAVLVVAMDIQAKENGEFALAGVKAKALEGFPKNTNNPDELFIDATENGFGIFATGQISPDGDGRFLQTEPFDVNLSIGPVGITLTDVRVAGSVIELDGHDSVDGNISFSSVVLDTGSGDPFTYDAGNTTVALTWVATGDLPEGYSTLCGDNLCGHVEFQCNPPEEFPPAGFCE
jgi:hypothetical protein